MNNPFYIPPPFPFPEQWGNQFLSSAPSPWLTYRDPLYYPPMLFNTQPIAINQETQTQTKPKVDENPKEVTTEEPKYKIVISDEWIDFVERSYIRMQEKKRSRKKR